MRTIIVALCLLFTFSAFGQKENEWGEVWQKVQSNGEELYVNLKAGFTVGPEGSAVFHTRIVRNLPDSDIVDAPESVQQNIDGYCGDKVYTILGELYYSGKNRSGLPTDGTDSEGVAHKVIPGSAMAKVFDLVCNSVPTAKTAPIPTSSIPKPSPDISDAFYVAWVLKGQCQNSHPVACSIRDMLIKTLKNKGWCKEQDDTPAHPCQSQKSLDQ
jgi:hypothetical protein